MKNEPYNQIMRGYLDKRFENKNAKLPQVGLSFFTLFYDILNWYTVGLVIARVITFYWPEDSEETNLFLYQAATCVPL